MKELRDIDQILSPSTPVPKTHVRYPSVDRIARRPQLASLMETYGRIAVVDSIRVVIDAHRRRANGGLPALSKDDDILAAVVERLRRRATPALTGVFNLTGTVLHTNLGRALLSEAAVAHAAMAMREACNLEFDLKTGARGERDSLVEDVLTELTGAEAATVVNNNAAAVLLVLAALASEREIIVSRGELIEIGGAFRIPDVMRSANVRLVEVGATNRTHPHDYEGAIGPATAALMKVHASNYKISGFVAEVSSPTLAAMAHRHGLPFIIDLGAGSFIDLTAHGLPREPIVREVIATGADIVTFSGDKLLGGPQAGLIVGKKALIDKLKRHPLKRALRLSKITLAALEGTLLAYRTPDRLAMDLPTLRLLTRPVAEIEAMARRLAPIVKTALGDDWDVAVVPVSSQVGSGSLPVDMIPSAALAITYRKGRSGQALKALVARFRRLPRPVIGRIAEDQLIFDLRCLENEAGFKRQLEGLGPADGILSATRPDRRGALNGCV